MRQFLLLVTIVSSADACDSRACQFFFFLSVEKAIKIQERYIQNTNLTTVVIVTLALKFHAFLLISAV